MILVRQKNWNQFLNSELNNVHTLFSKDQKNAYNFALWFFSILLLIAEPAKLVLKFFTKNARYVVI